MATILIGSMASFPAHAIGKLYSPYVEKGEWELEYFGTRSVDGESGKNNEQQHQFSVGYAVNDWWHVEVYRKYAKEPQAKTKFDQYELENIFQLTEQGEYWLDVGGYFAYEYTPQHSRTDTVETKLILEKDIGRFLNILDINLEKDIGSGPKAGFEPGFLWSSRYNYSKYFDPGFEISSSFNEINRTGSYNAQQHYIGPVAYGKIPLHITGQYDAVKYRMGYLFGVSTAANDGEAVAQIEYEIHF